MASLQLGPTRVLGQAAPHAHGQKDVPLKLELLDYQAEAAEKVAKSLIRAAKDFRDDPAELSAVVLSAPTGAGKTVIATAVVEASLDGDESTPGIEDATFLWVTDDPSLNRQTMHKMMAASSALAPNRLLTIENDFDQEVLDNGVVYFLNIQKLSSSANLSKSRSDSRTYSLWETLANTIKEKSDTFVVIIDEAHRGMGSSSTRRDRDTIVSQIIGGGATGRPAAPIVWGISATPRRFLSAMAEVGRQTRAHTVPVDAVRASGLLKDQIVLGHTGGIDAAESTLIRHAVRRTRESDARWHVYTEQNGEPPVRPALVIQVADKPSTSDLSEIVTTLSDEWPDVSLANIVHVFGEHADLKLDSGTISWSPPEDIQDRTEIRVVLCKTAITTGWDCPRAEVLVSLRVAKDIDTITQVMGRMVRTPLARRIHSFEDLNAVHCILPKFDQDAVDAIAEKFRTGDPDVGSGGTVVVTKPSSLTWNPSFSAARPASGSGSSFSGNTTDGSADEESTAGAAPATGGITDTHDQLATDSGNTVLQNPASTESPRTPSPRPSMTTKPSPQPDNSVPNLFSDPQPDQSLTAVGTQDVFGVVQSLPSYTIPRRSFRSPIARLASLALLLAATHDGKAIHAAARTEFTNQLLAVIDVYRANLTETGEFDQLLARAKSTRLIERLISLDHSHNPNPDTNTTINLDARGINILMNRARSLLPEGLAKAYANKIAPSDDEVNDALVVTIALANEESLRTEIEARASQLLEHWFDKFSSTISHLPESDQDRFDRIKREADRPLRTTLTIPTNKIEEAVGDQWPRHLLSDAEGKYRAGLREWERHVLQQELDAGCVAWYRNPPSGRHALQIPYTASSGVAGLSPDFIFLNQVGGRLVASLVDPHGTHLNDATAKLRGMAMYADRHGTEFHRLQSVAKIGNAYRMIDHQQGDIREAVLEASDSVDVTEVFNKLGVSY